MQKRLTVWILLSLLALVVACNMPTWIKTQRATSLPILHPTQPAATPITIKTQPAPPSDEIIKLANAATMTDKAKAIFYAAYPIIDTDRGAFEKHCQTQITRNNVELGCFTTDKHIYLLKLEDPRLSDEMVVVAAHEMLHAAYQGFLSSTQETINEHLELQLNNISDPDLSQRLNDYRIHEPGERDNELHSIIGTEYTPLDPKLEQYYSAYFNDRATIVASAQKFNLVFSQLKTTLNDLESQIVQMRQEMQADRADGHFKAYNALVPQINSLIDQYNQGVKEYNALSRELIGEEAATKTQ